MAKADSGEKGGGLPVVDIFLGSLIALICGLDRVAALQLMVSRPIVAAPLVGWLLGQPEVGLQVGLLVELLWLSRLPVGAVIPPDDTQVSIAATVLAIGLATTTGFQGIGFVLLCLLVAIPFGKCGQFFDRYARTRNGGSLRRADSALAAGNFAVAEHQHLLGLCRFAVAALATYLAIILGGGLLVPLLAPILLSGLERSAGWLQVALPLVGVAVILGTINVSRALTLFAASFGMAFLLMWLV